VFIEDSGYLMVEV